MSYEGILYEAVIGRREEKMQMSRKWTVLPFLNSKVRLTGEGERKWEETRSELQWDPGPCGVLCTRIRTWDFAVPTKGSTAGCWGWSHDSHMSLSKSLCKAKFCPTPGPLPRLRLLPGMSSQSLRRAISYSPKCSLSGKLVLTLPNRLDSPAEQSNHPILPFCGTYQNYIT